MIRLLFWVLGGVLSFSFFFFAFFFFFLDLYEPSMFYSPLLGGTRTKQRLVVQNLLFSLIDPFLKKKKKKAPACIHKFG